MTNGEKLKQICPEWLCLFSKSWLASEYKEPTTKNDHHKQNIEAYAHDFGVSEEQAEKELRVTTKNDLGVDWDELKRKIFMEVDGGTDDRLLRYGDVCDRISNSIDEFIANMRGKEE